MTWYSLYLLVAVVAKIYAQDPSQCVFPDGFQNGYILNLSSLAGTKISGGTSSYNTYEYSVCSDDYKCKGKCMINQVNKQSGDCECLQTWDNGDTIPFYFTSQQTWEYQYFSDNYFTRVWWICNQTADPYSIRFTGAEADGMFGIYIESKSACVQQSNDNDHHDKEKDIKLSACNDNSGCSYNGICQNNKCECFPQWMGDNCASLNFVATPKDNGLQTIINGNRVSSWGGSVIRDDNGTFWMYAAEMGWYCGINVWLSNSLVVMAKSSKIDSNGVPTQFTRIEGDDAIIGNLFSHEPSATRALDTGEYVIYFSNIDPPPTSYYPCNTGDSGDGYCFNGTSLDCDIQIPRNWDSPIPTKMIYSQYPNGPWSDYIDIPTQDPSIDSNLATYIFPNGSLVGIARGDDIYVYHANNWRNVSDYKYEPVKLPPNCCGEDPYIWMDPRYGNDGVLHVIWHAGGWDDPVGVHTWSTDGGYTWDHIKNVFAYQNSVLFTDGSNFNYQRCERPHLIMDKDNVTPLALTNAVENGGHDCDYSHTLVRPLNQK